MPGYKDWIDAIDIKVDYFSAFMKAWIAFNAWYNFSGEVEGANDKDCIEYIASQSNRFKTYTMNLINAEDADGSAYREHCQTTWCSFECCNHHTGILRGSSSGFVC